MRLESSSWESVPGRGTESESEKSLFWMTFMYRTHYSKISKFDQIEDCEKTAFHKTYLPWMLKMSSFILKNPPIFFGRTYLSVKSRPGLEAPSYRMMSSADPQSFCRKPEPARPARPRRGTASFEGMVEMRRAVITGEMREHGAWRRTNQML